jgi:hypothetical protein
MYPNKKRPVLVKARAIAIAAARDLASTAWNRQTGLSRTNVLQVIHRIFDLLEVEFSEVILVDLTEALGCVFRGKVDSSEEIVLRVADRTFEVMDIEFQEFEMEVLVRAIGCVFCGLEVCLS